MDNFLVAVIFGFGTLFGLVVGLLMCTYYHNRVLKQRLDMFIQNLDVIFGDLIVDLDNTLEKRFAPPPKRSTASKEEVPPPHVMEKLAKMAGISSEIQDLVMTLDGPLKGGLDAKYRKANAAKIRALQEEMKEVINEILRLGFDPKIMFMDAYGNKQITVLSKLLDRITKGPDDLQPFSDDKPNLSIIDEEVPPQVPPTDTNVH